MKTSTAIIVLSISVGTLAYIYISDHLAKRKRQAAVGTDREVRMRFSSWTLRLQDSCNMEDAMVSYEKRYEATFKRMAGESDRKFRLRRRIEFIEQSLDEFDPEVRTGLARLLEHYRLSLLMPESQDLKGAANQSVDPTPGDASRKS